MTFVGRWEHNMRMTSPENFRDCMNSKCFLVPKNAFFNRLTKHDVSINISGDYSSENTNM